MSNGMRPDILERILAYEELGASERLEIDRYLVDHPDLAAQLERIRVIERAAQEPVPVSADDGFWVEQDLDGETERQCRTSARRVQASLGSTRRRTWRDPRWLLPIAAVLALVVILPLRARRDTLLTGLAIETFATTQDGTRSGRSIPLATGVLRDGDAFVLAFELRADSYLAVVHVDPRGDVALVYPSQQSRVVRLDGGRRHQLPDPDNDETWILGGATGRESFVVATDADGSPSVEELQAALAAVTGGHDRAATLEAARALMAATWDQVEIIEFSHVE